MRSAKVFRTILGAGMSVALFASAAQAQPEDKRTYFTFSGPIALPGVTLPAGRYLFHIVDTTASRKVIQVLSDDQKKPYTMANTIADQRRDPPNDATVVFYESARGTPAAVKSWWYPGETIGYQFIYPRTQAKQIAKATGQPVLTTRTDSTKSEETKSAELTRVDAKGRDVAVDCVRSYRRRMAEFASMDPLSIWYARITEADFLAAIPKSRQADIRASPGIYESAPRNSRGVAWRR